MPKLRKAVSLETTFDTYLLDEQIGQGGAGHVYGGTSLDGSKVAIKVLKKDGATIERRKRFKNEIGFLAQNKHPNVVTVIDHGLSQTGDIIGPFYVMQRYNSSLRDLINAGIPSEQVLSLFSQILDGVEAAHLKGVIHRDLKPENILYDQKSGILAVADFGIARFSDDIALTLVETSPAQRLANFQYAAPEQRTKGEKVEIFADIWALGLILNEMFTGQVPHGTDFRTIGQVVREKAFLDEIVQKSMRQRPHDRPSQISEIKSQILKYEAEVVSFQKLSKINGTVIKIAEIDEPLAEVPPKLIDFNWNRGSLTLILDRQVDSAWIQALYGLRNFTSVMGKEPGSFAFYGDRTTISAREEQIQPIIDYFKQWLPLASQELKRRIEEAQQRRMREERDRLRQEREAEEQSLRVRQRIKI